MCIAGKVSGVVADLTVGEKLPLTTGGVTLPLRAQTTGKFVAIVLDVHVLTLLVSSSGARVYGSFIDAHHDCLEVLNNHIVTVDSKFLPLRHQDVSAQSRDLQRLFTQSEEEMWINIRFIHTWFNACKIEDVAYRAFKSIYANIEIYIHAQAQVNQRNIETAQKTALTSPFRLNNGELQFIVGQGTDEIADFENVVTDSGRESIFRLFLDDLWNRFMTKKHLGELASEKVTLSYLDDENQIRVWSETFLNVFELTVCLQSPSQLQDIHKGVGPNEKSVTFVSSLLPVVSGWETMSLAKSQFVQRVFKRLHATFPTGSSRSASSSKDGTYDSPLPLAKGTFGAVLDKSVVGVGNKRRNSASNHSSKTAKRATPSSMDTLSVSAGPKQSSKRDLNAEVFDMSWWINHGVLALSLSMVEYTHWLRVSVEPYLTHRRIDQHPIEFLVPVFTLNARKYMAEQSNASKAPSSDAVRNCLSSLPPFQDAIVVLKKGNLSAASSIYLADHPSHRLTIFNQLNPSDREEASSSDARGVETIELRLSPSCRGKIPLVEGNIVVDPVNNHKTIVLPTVFDPVEGVDNEGSKVSLLYSYLSSRMERRELSKGDKDLLEAERRVDAARRNE